MTQKDKELLLQDLCARLLYKVKCKEVTTLGGVSTIGGYYNGIGGYDFFIEEIGGCFSMSEIKPYLRPMSSMTKGEKKELEELKFLYSDGHIATGYQSKDEPVFVDEVPCITIIDWLNSHHFDYRGLIEKGLALKAPSNMYDLNEE